MLYLECTQFTVWTVHDVLCWKVNLADLSRKLRHWPLRFSQFELDLVYRAVTKHQAADALSQLPTDGQDTTELDDELLVLTVMTT